MRDPVSRGVSTEVGSGDGDVREYNSRYKDRSERDSSRDNEEGRRGDRSVVTDNSRVRTVNRENVFNFKQSSLITAVSERDKQIAKDIVLSGKKSYWGRSHEVCIKAFYEAIDQNIQPEITVSDSIVTNELVLGIYKSSNTNEKYIMKEVLND